METQVLRIAEHIENIHKESKTGIMIVKRRKFGDPVLTVHFLQGIPVHAYSFLMHEVGNSKNFKRFLDKVFKCIVKNRWEVDVEFLRKDHLFGEYDELRKLFGRFVEEMGSGLVASSIWNKHTSATILGYSPDGNDLSIFNEVSKHIEEALAKVKLPSVNRFYMIEVKDNMVVFIVHLNDEWIQGMLLDTSKIQIGLVMNYIVPKMIEEFNRIALT